ncbi:MAG: acyl-CoA dehydrogenase [Gammaproteobacteria bacterium]|nr:acyl-CoA dehydrogenase [Gammaproteobacteria bacterium]
MKIALSDEQKLLLETAQSFFNDRAPIQKSRESIESGAFNQSLWREMVALGWNAVNIKDQYGGLGLALENLVPIFEAMGRHLVGSPLMASSIASGLISSFANEEIKATSLSRIASGELATLGFYEENGAWDHAIIDTRAEPRAEGFEIFGKKCFVTDLDFASFLLISAKVGTSPEMFLLESNQIPPSRIKKEVVIDQTIRSFEVDLSEIFVTKNQILDSDARRWADLWMLLLSAAEMSGGLSAVLKMTVDYLKTRKAFDRLIGSYQSLKHPTVDILISSEALRSHIYFACNCLGAGLEKEAEIAIRMANALGSESFTYASDRAIQFHGGFGFTYDCDAQLFLRRALWQQYHGGDQVYQRKLLEPLLLD